MWLVLGTIFSDIDIFQTRQVVCGGLTVEAHRRPLPTRCSLCLSSCVPSTEHVLWHCPRFSSLRILPQPWNPVLARLGWSGDGPSPVLIAQMASIREQSCKLYYSYNLNLWRKPRPPPAPRGRGGLCAQGLTCSLLGCWRQLARATPLLRNARIIC